jgi:hypothetical protein
MDWRKVGLVQTLPKGRSHMKEERNIGEAMKQANEVFAKMRHAVEESAKKDITELDILEISRKAGLEELDEDVLRELQLPRIIPVHPWLPWHYWWPWRPIWCWWWHRYYPWYGWCCPWWWYRCHWYPLAL